MACCEEYFELIGEYAHGDGAELSPDERAALEAHLIECDVCRRQLQPLAELMTFVSISRTYEVPDDIANTLHVRVMRALRARRRIARLVFHLAVPTAALLALGLLWAWFHTAPTAKPRPDHAHLTAQSAAPSHSHTSTQNKPLNSTPRPSGHLIPVPGYCPAHSPNRNLYYLKKHLTSLSSDQELRSVLARLDELQANAPFSDAALDAQKLKSFCYWKLGLPQRSYDSFLEYINQLSTRQLQSNASDTRRVTSLALKLEADRLFGQRDFTLAQEYYELLVTRYSGTDIEYYARYRLAMLFSRVGMRDTAIDAITRLVEAAPSSRWAQDAMHALPYALFNDGQKDQAVRAALIASDASNSTSRSATALLCAAEFLAAQDSPQALVLFNDLVARYPGTQHAHLAAERLRRYSAKQVDAIIEDVF